MSEVNLGKIALAPRQMIFSKITEVMRAIDAVAKDQRNEHQKYKFRGIDDIYNALHTPLAEAGVFYIPEVLESKDEVFTKGDSTTRQIRVKLKIRYTFFAEDGSNLSSIVEGEAIDSSDKATNKAMSAALKYMLMQVFCIPTEESGNDPDETSPTLNIEPDKTKHFQARRSAIIGDISGDLPVQGRTVVEVTSGKSFSDNGTPMHCNKPMMTSRFNNDEWYCFTCKTKLPKTQAST